MLVDGAVGHTNWEDTIDMVYLPISMGYCECYLRYMAGMEYEAVIVEGEDGKPVISCKFVSLSMYCVKWKKIFPAKDKLASRGHLPVLLCLCTLPQVLSQPQHPSIM